MSVSIRKICEVLQINRSNVYYQEKKRKKIKTDEWLKQEIWQVIEKYPWMGVRRITAELRRKLNKTLNRKRIHRIIKEQGWQCVQKPKGSRPRARGIRSVTPQINSRWAIDTTHIFTAETGWCHMTAVIDCCDRYVVGWRFSRSGKADVAAGAVEDGFIIQKLKPGGQGLIIRSDNGLVFGSKRFQETIKRYKLFQEYITPYTPEQNGLVERFFRTLKEECIWQHNFKTYNEAYSIIADWMENYNFKRLHSALGYRTPAEVRQELAA